MIREPAGADPGPVRAPDGGKAQQPPDAVKRHPRNRTPTSSLGEWFLAAGQLAAIIADPFLAAIIADSFLAAGIIADPATFP